MSSPYSENWKIKPTSGLQIYIIEQAIGKRKTKQLIEEYVKIKIRNHKRRLSIT